MYKFEIMLEKGFLRVRIWEGMCRFYEETTGIKYGQKKKPLKTVNPPLILPAVRVLALFKVQVLPLKSHSL